MSNAYTRLSAGSKASTNNRTIQDQILKQEGLINARQHRLTLLLIPNTYGIVKGKGSHIW